MKFAVTANGLPIYPDQFDEPAWNLLKDSYQIGDFLMPCCLSPAVPKTSSNGLQFFAHSVDECSTSPESQWHLATKEKVLRELAQLGASPRLEYSFRDAGRLIKSDVFCDWRGRRIALEIQHSYQSFSEYLQRQEKYKAAGIDNYWLIYQPRYLTLVSSIAKFRLRRDFGNKMPPNGFFPFIPELPIALYDPDIEGGKVGGGKRFSASLADWLSGVLSGISCTSTKYGGLLDAI